MATSNPPANYQSYEATLSHLQKRYFHDFIFINKEHVLEAVNGLEDDPYCLKPDVPSPEKNPDQIRAKTSRAIKHDSTNKDAEILKLSAAQAKRITGFLEEKFNRKIVPLPDLDLNQNCAVSSVLVQLGNKDFIQSREGTLYDSSCFRDQIVYQMAKVNPEELYQRCKLHLTESYKSMLERNLDNEEEGDFSMLIGARDLIGVCVFWDPSLCTKKFSGSQYPFHGRFRCFVHDPSILIHARFCIYSRSSVQFNIIMTDSCKHS